MERSISRVLRPSLRGLRGLGAALLRKTPISSETLGPPKRWYRTTQEWLGNRNVLDTRPIVAYTEVFSGQTVDLGKCQSLDGKEHKTLDDRTYAIPAAFVCAMPSGRVIGTTVVTADDAILADLSQAPLASNSQHLAVYHSWKLPTVRHVRGTAVMLRPSVRNYCHWMLESLSGFHLLEKGGYRLADIDHFIVQGCCSDYQSATLAELGVPQSKVIRTVDCPHAKVDRLIVPSSPFSPFLPDRGIGATRWACQFLRDTFSGGVQREEPGAARLRLYVGRADASLRRVLNEDALIECLRSLGFSIVQRLGEMPVTDQATLFSSAGMIVSPHGAALTNLVFCSPGTTVVELFSPNWIHPCYANLCALMGYEYRYYIARSGHTGERGENAFDLMVSQRERRASALRSIRRWAADPIVVDIERFAERIERLV